VVVVGVEEEVLEQQQGLVVEEEKEQDCQGQEEGVGDSQGQDDVEESLVAEPELLTDQQPGALTGRVLTSL
jgi:hypothetical protein